MKSISPLADAIWRQTLPWTCRSCEWRQQLLRSRPQTAFKSLPQFTRRTYATTPLQQIRTQSKRHTKLIVLTALGTGLAVGAYTHSADAKHFWDATVRASRVAYILAVNVNDYRKTLKRDSDPDYKEQLKACHQRCANRTLVGLEKNGSIFIKLGQHLTSLNYLLPREWCDTFIPLQDKCPMSSIESIEEMVLHDTGAPISEYFSEFASLPIGAASLAQVHKATLKDGRKVAVKVQHPSLDEWAPLDLALTRFTFSAIKYFFPEYDLTWLGEELAISLPQELDFELEGKNAIRAAEYFSHVRDCPVIIPQVYMAKRRFLVMEFVTGYRPDNLEALDREGIDRDEVSAALARIFNTMIFGKDAPLHCDPHGGNLAIRRNDSRRYPHNFDVIIYDHGLYRDIPASLRRSYAKLWLALIDADEPRMRKYAYEVAGISDEQFPLFASAITGRDYKVVKTSITQARTEAEKEVISGSLGEGLLQQLVQILSQVPRVVLLILKTNDLTRSLDENLQTTQGPIRSFLILARYAAHAVLEEQLEALKGSAFLPRNWRLVFDAWRDYAKVQMKLTLYELYLSARRLLGLSMPIVGPQSSPTY